MKAYEEPLVTDTWEECIRAGEGGWLEAYKILNGKVMMIEGRKGLW